MHLWCMNYYNFRSTIYCNVLRITLQYQNIVLEAQDQSYSLWIKSITKSMSLIFEDLTKNKKNSYVTLRI